MRLRDEIEQMLAAHRVYLETEWRLRHRANFPSADLSGQDFSGSILRGITWTARTPGARTSQELSCTGQIGSAR